MSMPSEPSPVTELDEGLLSDLERGWDWPELEALADRLAGVPGGWRQVAEQFRSYQERALVDPELDEVTWLKAPAVLSLIGAKVDEPSRLAIAGELIDAMDRYDLYHDFGHEVLLYSMLYLGPSILPVVFERLRVADPESTGWFSLLGLLDLTADARATPAERTAGIDTCESLLRRAVAGEVDGSDVETAAWPLVELMHTASADLLDQAARKLELRTGGRHHRMRGVNELRMAHEVLIGKTAAQSYSLERDRVKDGLEPVLERYWNQTLEHYADQDREIQADFEDELSWLAGQKPLPRPDSSFIPPHKPRKVGRNEPCPCGSGKKYKKCCGPRMR